MVAKTGMRLDRRINGNLNMDCMVLTGTIVESERSIKEEVVKSTSPK